MKVTLPSHPHFSPLKGVAVMPRGSSVSKSSKIHGRKWAKSVVEAGRKISKFGSSKVKGREEKQTVALKTSGSTESLTPTLPPSVPPPSTIWTVTSLYFETPTLGDYSSLFGSDPCSSVFSNPKSVGSLEGKRKRLEMEERKVRRKVEEMLLKSNR